MLSTSGNFRSETSVTKTQKMEFWGPLFEKAYAKLYGSYKVRSRQENKLQTVFQDIVSGSAEDAGVDFTGGIPETVQFGSDHFWSILRNSQHSAFRNSQQTAFLSSSLKPGTEGRGLMET